MDKDTVMAMDTKQSLGDRHLSGLQHGVPVNKCLPGTPKAILPLLLSMFLLPAAHAVEQTKDFIPYAGLSFDYTTNLNQTTQIPLRW